MKTTQELKESRYLGRKSAAAYLGIGVRMLDRLVAERRLPSARIGTRVVLDAMDLDSFMAASKQPAAQAS